MPRNTTFDESLPCANSSEGFLYSSIMFAFLFVLILRVPKLIRQTGIFSLKHFSLERKRKKKTNLSHGKGQDQHQPLGANSSGSMGKPRQVRRQHTKHIFWPFIQEVWDWERLMMPKPKLRGIGNVAQCHRLNLRALLAVTCKFLSCDQREHTRNVTKASPPACSPQHTHQCSPRTHEYIHAALLAQTQSLSLPHIAHTHVQLPANEMGARCWGTPQIPFPKTMVNNCSHSSPAAPRSWGAAPLTSGWLYTQGHVHAADTQPQKCQHIHKILCRLVIPDGMTERFPPDPFS